MSSLTLKISMASGMSSNGHIFHLSNEHFGEALEVFACLFFPIPCKTNPYEVNGFDTLDVVRSPIGVRRRCTPRGFF